MSAIKLQVGMGGRVARVTLNRPDRFNAFNREMLRELGDIVRGLGDSEKVRVVVLTGEGQAFCAGADLRAAAESDQLSSYIGSLAKAFHVVLEAMAASPALIVSLVNGPAAGGGMALALAGDLRWGMPGARFRAGYGRVGLTVDGGLSWRLPRLVGLAHAQQILFEDPDLDVDEAQALGLVHKVVPESDIKGAVEQLVEKVSKQARMAIARNRKLLLESQGRSIAESMEAEAILIKTSAATNDGSEGVRAFVEKRAPSFGS